MQGPNPFEGVPANGMRCAVVRPVAATATFAAKVAALQQAHWNSASGPGRPVSRLTLSRPLVLGHTHVDVGKKNCGVSGEDEFPRPRPDLQITCLCTGSWSADRASCCWSMATTHLCASLTLSVMRQASETGSSGRGGNQRGAPPSPPTGPPVHAPFWNEPVIRDYIKQASQHGLTRQTPPGAPAAAERGEQVSTAANGAAQSGQIKAAANGDVGQRREYGRVLSAPATAGEPAGQQPAGGGGYDPDAAPRIRTVKMRGVQPRTPQDGTLRR